MHTRVSVAGSLRVRVGSPLRRRLVTRVAGLLAVAAAAGVMPLAAVAGASVPTDEGAGVEEGAVATPPDPSERPIPDVGAGPDESVLVRQDETTAEWSNPDGSHSVEIAAGPVRFEDASGNWIDIDLTLVENLAGKLVPRAAGHPPVFNPTGGSSTVEFPTDAGTIVVGYPDLAPGSQATLERAPAGSGRNDMVRFPGAMPGDAHLELIPTSVGFQEQVVLDSPAAPAFYLLDVTVPAGMTAAAVPGGIVFSNDGDTVVSFGGGIAIDSSPGPMGGLEKPLGFEIVSNPPTGVIRIRVSVDPAWLHDPARVFPVVLDPWWESKTSDGSCPSTYYAYTACDTHIDSYYTTSALTTEVGGSRPPLRVPGRV